MSEGLVTTGDHPEFWASPNLPDRRYNDPVLTPTRVSSQKKLAAPLSEVTARSKGFFNN
jgi:hypothetical protein